MSKFSHWNHRVLVDGSGCSIIEVFYDKDNRITSWSRPHAPWGEDVEELRADLELQATAFKYAAIKAEDLPK